MFHWQAERLNSLKWPRGSEARRVAPKGQPFTHETSNATNAAWSQEAGLCSSPRPSVRDVHPATSPTLTPDRDAVRKPLTLNPKGSGGLSDPAAPLLPSGSPLEIAPKSSQEAQVPPSTCQLSPTPHPQAKRHSNISPPSRFLWEGAAPSPICQRGGLAGLQPSCCWGPGT